MDACRECDSLQLHTHAGLAELIQLVIILVFPGLGTRLIIAIEGVEPLLHPGHQFARDIPTCMHKTKSMLCV